MIKEIRHRGRTEFVSLIPASVSVIKPCAMDSTCFQAFFHALALLGRRNYVNDGNKNGCSLLVACNVGRFFGVFFWGMKQSRYIDTLHFNFPFDLLSFQLSSNLFLVSKRKK